MTLLDKAIDYLAPWTKRSYPGRRRGVLAVLDRDITWEAVRAWRSGRHPLPAWAAERLAERIETECREGWEIAHLLRDHIREEEKAAPMRRMRMRRNLLGRPPGRGF